MMCAAPGSQSQLVAPERRGNNMFALACDSQTRGRIIELKPPDHHNGVDAEAHAAVVGGPGLGEVAVERLVWRVEGACPLPKHQRATPL